MAVQVSYPGVYVQETASGVRTIVGVSTSITGFIGRTARGEPDTATTINNWGDFEREFGGLSELMTTQADLTKPLIREYSTVAFAVRDFFLNGGGQAVVVRLYSPPSGAIDGRTTYDVGQLTFVARDPGTFGRNIRIAVDTSIAPGMDTALGLTKAKMFNLTVVDTNPGGRTERYANLTVDDHPQRVDRILEAQSSLVRWTGADPADTLVVAAGKDPVSEAQDALDTALKAQPYVQANVDTARANLETAIGDLTGSDGADVDGGQFNPAGGQTNKKGLYAFEQADLINLLVIPPFKPGEDVPTNLIALAASYCERRRAFLILDPPSGWTSPGAVVTAVQGGTPLGTNSDHAAVYYPAIEERNQFHANALEAFPPSGAVAGIFARTDADRGVWKAPAGLGAALNGVEDLAYHLTDAENGQLNPHGVNCLRLKVPGGLVVYGARTLQGDDGLASEYKYIPIRRLALYIEESAYRGTQWAVFEPNDEPLWSQLRLNLGAFMHDLFRKGAFQGQTPTDAYFVKCDSETTTQSDINLGIVNVVIGFAPLRPAEFVVITVRQMAGKLEV